MQHLFIIVIAGCLGFGYILYDTYQNWWPYLLDGGPILWIILVVVAISSFHATGNS